MTKEQFIGLLRSPSTINLNLVGELEDITNRFPYFQNAHLLLAKQYHGHENIRFESYLRKAAVYAQDRSILYRLIKTEAEEIIHIQSANTPVIVTAEQSSLTALKNEPENITDEEIVITPSSIVITNEPIDYLPEQEVSDITDVHTPIEIEEPIIINGTDPRSVIEQRLKEIANQDHDSFESNQLDTSVQNITKPAKSADTGSSSEYTEKPVEQFRKPVTVSTENISIKKTEKTEVQKSTPSKSAEPEIIKHSFSEWLKLKTIEIIQPGKPGIYFDTLKDSDAATTPNSEWRSNDLLENFIKTEPRIVPARSEFYSPGNMARKSAIEHEDLISETLARIYAQQGNIPKAIDAYQRLSLKNPEKSGYFAALIKELEQKGAV